MSAIDTLEERLGLCNGVGIYIVAAPAMMLATMEKYFILRFVSLDWVREKDGCRGIHCSQTTGPRNYVRVYILCWGSQRGFSAPFEFSRSRFSVAV